MATSDAPVTISRVSLTVNDLDRMASYYRSVLGLQLLHSDGEIRQLGVESNILLELRQDRHARQYPFEAGLFHNAFLLPSRVDLGRWLRHIQKMAVPLTGATDHGVSEAMYMRDPEGNGIEVYVDRPRKSWIFEDGEVQMGSQPIDFDALSEASPGAWRGAPSGTVIGHVHLQVGNMAEADRFFRDQLGLTCTAKRPSAGFYAWGGYHHHFAGNIWNSDRAGKRSADATGLAEIELAVAGASTSLKGGMYTDPWGTQIVAPAQAPDDRRRRREPDQRAQ